MSQNITPYIWLSILKTTFREFAYKRLWPQNGNSWMKTGYLRILNVAAKAQKSDDDSQWHLNQWLDRIEFGTELQWKEKNAEWNLWNTILMQAEFFCWERKWFEGLTPRWTFYSSDTPLTFLIVDSSATRYAILSYAYIP